MHPRRSTLAATLAACLLSAPALCLAASETVIHAFDGRGGGYDPQATLVHLGSALYGTTASGAVFAVKPGGQFRVIYSFPASQTPDGHLLALNGVLYGTTLHGGGSGCGGGGCGTVYSVTPQGVLTQIYAFKGAKDGLVPAGGLVFLNGLLYGTTMYGGDASNGGTFFSVSLQGAKTTLYTFHGGADGAQPNGLITDGTKFYGTSYAGGGTGCANQSGCGSVFALDASGGETLIHGFADGAKGEHPLGHPVKLGSRLYGTTSLGGEHQDGTVFRVTLAGAFKSLHSFAVSDGYAPYAGLTDVGGLLYGTTVSSGPNGAGTIFSITKSGTLTTLYGFSGGTDGNEPESGLTELGGTLYGTTYFGGGKGLHTGDCPEEACGTVFAFTP